MSGIRFNIQPVGEKPERKNRVTRKSKYDPIIDKFLGGSDSLVSVEIKGRDANYIRTQLKKRIDARELSDKVEVSVVSNKAYIEKL